jgi:hypothetical protein
MLLACCHCSLVMAQSHQQQLYRAMPHRQQRCHLRCLLLAWQHRLHSLHKQRCCRLVTTKAVAAHRPCKRQRPSRVVLQLLLIMRA